MLNFKAKIFVFVSLCFAFNPVLAVHVASLYDVEILVLNESTDSRLQAFTKGLDEIFVRISGDSVVMDKIKRPPSSRYVKQFSYDPVEKPVPNEKGELLKHRLKIQYNGSAMEEYLRKNGFPVWGEHRTEVVVWLAIRDGRNEYVLKDPDQSLIKAAADDALKRRGIPERWPLYDYKDRKILGVADIRGGFKEPVTAASKRYSRGPALTGSLIWNGKQWQSSWSLLMETGESHWSIENADYNSLINKAVDQAADAMAVVYAVGEMDDKRQLPVVQLDIQAVDSIEKYRQVETYLRELTAVEIAKPLKVDGQNVMFEVTLRSNEEDFLNLIKYGAQLVEAEALKPEVKQPPLQTELPENQGGTDISAANTGNNTEVDEAGQLPDLVTDQPAGQSGQQRVAIYHYRLIQ